MCWRQGVIRYLWSQPSPSVGKYLRVVQVEEFGELLFAFGAGVDFFHCVV